MVLDHSAAEVMHNTKLLVERPMHMFPDFLYQGVFKLRFTSGLNRSGRSKILIEPALT
jgi:hypothetical protein